MQEHIEQGLIKAEMRKDGYLENKNKTVYQETFIVGKTTHEHKEQYGLPVGCDVEIEVELKLKHRASLDWVTLKEVKPYYAFSCSGSVWQRNRKDIYQGGQMIDQIKEMFPLNDLVHEIYKLKIEYLLNDLQAGTYVQSGRIKRNIEAGKFSPDRLNHYTDCCNFLKSHKIYIHNGYKYGSKWLLKQIPYKVLKQVRTLHKRYNKDT